MIRELVTHNDPILKQNLPKFDFTNPPIDPVELAHDLAQTMLHYNGIGLAANQIGLPYRVFAIKADPILVCFNPIIVDESANTKIYLDEGCLSYPNLIIKVKRPAAIKVRYYQPNGEVVTEKFTGMTARIFMHELDHLMGINFTQRANKIHLEQARNKAKKLK